MRNENKLEIALSLLEDVIDKKNTHRRLEQVMKDKTYYDVCNDPVMLDKYNKYNSYKPTQIKQEIVLIRRLLNEASKEI